MTIWKSSRLREKKAAVCAQLRSWAACLARVFEVFPLVCPKCSVEMVPVAVIMRDRELVRLLTYLGLETEGTSRLGGSKRGYFSYN